MAAVGEAGSCEVHILQVGAGELNFSEIYFGQVTRGEVHAREVCLLEVCSKVCAGYVNVCGYGPCHGGFGEVQIAEILQSSSSYVSQTL